MNQSGLQLERYFFVKVDIQANQQGPANSGGVVTTHLEVSKDNNDPSRYMVALTVKLAVVEGKTAPYFGEVTVLGVFHVVAGAHKTGHHKPDDLVTVNGASILYGVAREMVANVSARGPWPAVTLPCMNFNASGQQQKVSEVSETTKAEDCK